MTTPALSQARLMRRAHIMEAARALVGTTASESTRDSFRKKLRAGELDEREVELEIADTSNSASRSALTYRAEVTP